MTQTTDELVAPSGTDVLEEQGSLEDYRQVNTEIFSSNRVFDEFEELVAQHYAPLYKFALSLTRAEADASDLTQQTFYLWATKGHQLREGSKVKTWLFTTLHNTFLQARRRQTRFPQHGLDEVAPEDLSASSPPPGDNIDSAQALRALAQVDEVYQGAVALFYLEDCSYKEIAEILEVAEGTVKSRISRGIAQLRHLLGYSVPTPSRPRANPENREETTLVNDEIAQMSKSHECSMR